VTVAQKPQTRVYVIYGWLGKPGDTLTGFVWFKDRLERLGYDVVDRFPWSDPDAIIKDIHEQPKGTKVALVGYSMGADCTSWVASAGQPIELIVAYDPSAGFGPFVAALPNPIRENVKRCICIVHQFDPIFRPAPFKGPTVELVETSSWHGAIAWDEDLHKITLQALKEI
jgi:hypothetical protein